MIRGLRTLTDGVRLDPPDIPEDRDRQTRSFEIRVESPHALAERGAAAVSAEARSSRDQVASRGEQRPAVVQVEAAQRIEAASLRRVEEELAGGGVDVGPPEEPPARVL